MDCSETKRLLNAYVDGELELPGQQLPLEFREVIILYELEGLSYKELAAALGIPVGTVMSRLSRARRRLQEGSKYGT